MRSPVKPLRCAIYTRVSTEHGLEQEFNSLAAQRVASTGPEQLSFNQRVQGSNPCTLTRKIKRLAYTPLIVLGG